MSFADHHLMEIPDTGLGNNGYAVDLGEGRALVVDASRDLRQLRRVLGHRGLKVAFAADTHLHADFLSGAVQLGHDDGATVVASAAGRRRFEHHGMADEDEVDLGGLTLRALATPGHTDEHLAFLLLDGSYPLGVFTGGSLMVDSAARTDLLGDERTDELTRAQYRSLQRLARLPDQVGVWPTHGPGSFCAGPSGGERTSTIGRQRGTNPLLRAGDEDGFVDQFLSGLGSYPAYFARLAEQNRAGPAIVTGEPALVPLDPVEVNRLARGGGWVIDVRSPAAYGAGHIPASLSLAMGDQFATWLGSLVPDDVPLVFVTDHPDQHPEIIAQAYKIGYQHLAGYLQGGIDAWQDLADRAVLVTDFLTAGEAGNRPVVDVRQAAEHAAGHIPGALHLELGTIVSHVAEVTKGAVLHCGHGQRSMTAASVLERAGRTDLVVLDGGPDDWADAHGTGLASGDGA